MFLILQMRNYWVKHQKANKDDIKLALQSAKKVSKFGKIQHHGKDQKLLRKISDIIRKKRCSV